MEASQINQWLEELNGLLTKHNDAASEIKKSKRTAMDALKSHMLFDSIDQFKRNKLQIEEKKQSLDLVDANIKSLAQQISSVEDSMKSHQKAAEHISNTITRFLGHGEISVKPNDDGYTICRDGHPVSGPMSEGERTAIAFCYFLVMLSAEGRIRLVDPEHFRRMIDICGLGDGDILCGTQLALPQLQN